MGAAVEIRNPGVDIYRCCDSTEKVFSRILLVVDEGFRKINLIALGARRQHP
jgi:hypothetical protein